MDYGPERPYGTFGQPPDYISSRPEDFYVFRPPPALSLGAGVDATFH